MTLILPDIIFSYKSVTFVMVLCVRVRIFGNKILLPDIMLRRCTDQQYINGLSKLLTRQPGTVFPSLNDKCHYFRNYINLHLDKFINYYRIHIRIIILINQRNYQKKNAAQRLPDLIPDPWPLNSDH